MANRKLKFRVWMPRSNRKKGAMSIPFDLRSRTTILDDFIVMQYLGLQDKNGVEIYEGDVLKKMGKDYQADIDFDANPDADYPIIEHGRDVATMERFPCFWLQGELFGYEGEDLEGPEDWEIIGNIHENPELLEASA